MFSGVSVPPSPQQPGAGWLAGGGGAQSGDAQGTDGQDPRHAPRLQ